MYVSTLRRTPKQIIQEGSILEKSGFWHPNLKHLVAPISTSQSAGGEQIFAPNFFVPANSGWQRSRQSTACREKGANETSGVDSFDLRLFLIYVWEDETIWYPISPTRTKGLGNTPQRFTSWWFQPLWKICTSNWIISLGWGENKKCLETKTTTCTVQHFVGGIVGNLQLLPLGEIAPFITLLGRDFW